MDAHLLSELDAEGEYHVDVEVVPAEVDALKNAVVVSVEDFVLRCPRACAMSPSSI